MYDFHNSFHQVIFLHFWLSKFEYFGVALFTVPLKPNVNDKSPLLLGILFHFATLALCLTTIFGGQAT